MTLIASQLKTEEAAGTSVVTQGKPEEEPV